ncbi:Atypical dual-specificity phosphatase Siw14-like [Trypanosoma melophagium]|uniref:Atypical dual-specificity phosphatase Siw14-like n=1 Tax=Trypanosoma melophagium TaxID=715481 RepID=UPI00351A98FF|nr:Atypical dual-specificity phosphatase Siw14-like [Trypanosoma melophagium]
MVNLTTSRRKDRVTTTSTSTSTTTTTTNTTTATTNTTNTVTCATADTTNDSAIDEENSLLIDPALLDVVPPFRFAVVEEGIYRGAYPTLRNFPFLRDLGLRTIVSLTPEEPTYDLSSFANAEGIILRHIRVERYKGEAQLLPTDMSELLQLLINVEKHPLYIHCLDGRQVVGLAIMGLRKLQQWDVNSSHLEYQRFARTVQDEVAFIADYSGPILVPTRIPPWLWKGSWYDTAGKPKRLHVGIRLKFPSLLRDAETSAPTRSGDGNFTAATSPLHTFIVTSNRKSSKGGGNSNTNTNNTNTNRSSSEAGVAYVDVPNITPAVPLGGSYHATLAVPVERPAAADVRFLSLRAAAETVTGMPPDAWEYTTAITHTTTATNFTHPAAATTTRTGIEISAASRATTQRCTPLPTAASLWDMDDETNSSHLSSYVVRSGLTAGSGCRASDGTFSSSCAAKHSSRSNRQLQFVAVGTNSKGPPVESNNSTKKPRRRNSL